MAATTDVTTKTPPIPYPVLAIRSPDDIEKAVQLDGVKKIVQANIQGYYTINVASSMAHLAQVGTLLQLAYAGSKNFPCETKIFVILSRHQDLVKASHQTTRNFVSTCIKALKLYKQAITSAEENDLADALDLVSGCVKLASNMGTECEKLITQSQELVTLSEDATTTAIGDKSVTVVDKKKVEESLKQHKAEQDALESKTKDLEGRIREQRAEKIKYEKRAEKAENRQFYLSIGSMLLSPLTSIGSAVGKVVGAAAGSAPAAAAGAATGGPAGAIMAVIGQLGKDQAEKQKNLQDLRVELTAKKAQLARATTPEEKNRIQAEIDPLEAKEKVYNDEAQQLQNQLKAEQDRLDKQREAALDKEAAAAAKLHDLQGQQMDVNANLAKSVTELKQLSVEKNELATSIKALEVTIKTMAQVMVVFKNTRVFWENVEKHCQDLTDQDMIERYGRKENAPRCIRALKESGLNWLALGQINNTAAKSIAAVDNKVDKIVSDLPTYDEAKSLIEKSSTNILAQLAQERAQITAQQSL